MLSYNRRIQYVEQEYVTVIVNETIDILWTLREVPGFFVLGVH